MAKAFSEARRTNALNVLSSLKVYPLTYFPHHLHPNNALFLNASDDDAKEMFTPSLGVQSTYPVKLHLPNPTNINAKVEENIVLKLIQQKTDYINNVTKLTGNYKRSKNGKKTKEHIYSMHLKNLIELTAKDPDPYFFGSYNWYFTGGVLETASIYDVDFLFYLTGEKLNIFNSATLSTNKNQLQLEHLDSTNKVIGETIFEITKSPDNFFVAARQKHQFTVFCLQNDLTQQDFHCERNIPFLSGAFNEKYFFTIDANRVIQRHDLAEYRECGRMHLKLPKNNSFWCQLRSYNNQLVFADHDVIKVYDSRLFAKKASKCMELRLDSVTEKCEEITCIQTDVNENNLYVSTTHNLFVFDIRYGMESGNQMVRYTHQMKTPPLMIDASGGGATGFAPNERLIALSGHFTDDISIAQHIKAQNLKIRNNNIPQKVLGMSDAYKKLRENGLQSEASNLLNKNRSINIGTRFARMNGNLYLLSEKASGEIFYQQIRENQDGQENEEIDEKLFRNIDLGEENVVETPTITTVTNFDSIKRIMKYELMNDNEVPDIENPRHKKWQLSIDQLSSYKDMLSSDLLNVWNDAQVTAVADRSNNNDFVRGWVDKTANDAPSDEDY